MNEAWKKIFKIYIECYKAIQTLKRYALFADEEASVLEHVLLHNIITNMEIEIETPEKCD